MAANKKPTWRKAARRTGLVLLPLMLGLAAAVGEATEPAQSPLISRAGTLPPPNFMVTLDTSWSMIFPYMPESKVTVNGYDLKFPSFNSPIMHPSDNRYDAAGGGATARANGNGGVILSNPTDSTSILQRWMRSADVNSIYYNPKKLYLPWAKLDAGGAVVRYPAADPAKAWFNPDITSPDNSTTRANLTAATTNVSAQWCLTVPANFGSELSCDASATSRSFAPGLFYVLNSPSANPNNVGSFTQWNVNSASGFPVAKWSSDRTDCDPTHCTQAQELQNYANWFVYHRTRLHVAQAAVPEAILSMDNDSIRLGWAAIHSNGATVDGVSSIAVIQGVRPLSTSLKNSLVSWLRSISSSNATTGSTPQPKLAGGTPLRIATAAVGQYFSRTDARSPWANDPSASDGGGPTSGHLTCRRSYNMLITDGYYNDSSAAYTSALTSMGITVGNADGALSSPYGDTRADRLADVAYKYWKADLQPSTADGVTATTKDSATWQHLNQFMVGLGVYGSYNASQWEQIKAGTLTPTWWVSPFPTDGAADIRKIDDLMHAALNSRGDYYSVKDSSDLVSAMNSALTLATAQTGSEAGVATAESTLVASNRKYIPEYNTGSWTGSLKAYELDASGRTVLDDTDDTNNDPLWDAANQVPAHGSRLIYTWDTGAPRLFTWAAMSTANKDLLGTLKSEDFVNFIRGDDTNEGDAGTGLYRDRTGRLPDFVNSPPVLIKGNLDMGYGADITGGSDYAAFYTAKNARNGTIFIGGNGGMLHAFNSSNGAEVFAYVPQAVYPKLEHLAQKSYGTSTNYHQAYVDGPLTEADAYIVPKGSATKSWRNILVASMGAGGRGLMAFDVTNAPTMDADSILWELAPVANMGYLMSEAQVGVLPGGTAWKVFVPNGHHSPAGTAALFVIDLKTGVIEKTLTVGSAGNNGLGGVRLVRNSKKEVVAAYAGDLDGKLWRFEFGGDNDATWQVGYNGNPLFTASSASGGVQPITAAPDLVSHPNGDGSNIVIVGTGKLMDEADRDDVSPQSIYGVWDKVVPETSTTSVNSAAHTAGATLRTSRLVRQTISTGSAVTTPGEGSDTISTQYYNVTANTVDWADDKLGWYIDTADIEAGVRTIYQPVVIDNFVLLSTVIPAGNVSGCGSMLTGRAFDFFIHADTGAQDDEAVIDSNRDLEFTNGDVVSGGFARTADGRVRIVLGAPPPPGGERRFSAQYPGRDAYMRVPPGGDDDDDDDCDPANPLSTCPTIKGRVWKQIINHPQSGL